jgi:hypothetical protein
MGVSYTKAKYNLFVDRLAQWFEYSPIAQENAGSIPALTFVCMNISICIGSGCFLYVFTKNEKHINIIFILY